MRPRRLILLIVVAIVGIGAAVLGKRVWDVIAETRKQTTPATYAYSTPAAGRACAGGAKTQPPPEDGQMETAKGTAFHVRTPSNYRADVPHPLIVVFAPAGFSDSANESLTRLTRKATAQGFVLAFVASAPLSMDSYEDQATIPSLVKGRWCIDDKRIFFTGHSNGGLVTNAVSFLPKTRGQAAAIAPSAAGIKGGDMAEYGCPKSLPVMVIHGANDELFPGWGRDAANWWAQCNKCEPRLSDSDDFPKCKQFDNCPTGARTYYCETDKTHASWPDLNETLLKFFKTNF